MATTGKWMCSTDEERWSDTSEFDTREEALAYALGELAPYQGLDDGDSVWIGQVREPSLDSLADAGVDAWSVIDSMTCWLYDNVGEFAQDSLDVSKEAEDDLDNRLTATIREWMTVHGIKPTCFLIDAIERHVFKQCEERNPTVSEETLSRCVHGVGHEGQHEFTP
jgi:hypothetical protein